LAVKHAELLAQDPAGDQQRFDDRSQVRVSGCGDPRKSGGEGGGTGTKKGVVGGPLVCCEG
jgi:hypothetical protein